MAGKSSVKYCKGCKKRKSRGAFRFDESKPDGLARQCRACSKANYLTIRERLNAYIMLKYYMTRAAEKPHDERYRREVRIREEAFRRKYPDYSLPSLPKPEQVEARSKERQRKSEEMFNRILEYQTKNLRG